MMPEIAGRPYLWLAGKKQSYPTSFTYNNGSGLWNDATCSNAEPQRVGTGRFFIVTDLPRQLLERLWDFTHSTAARQMSAWAMEVCVPFRPAFRPSRLASMVTRSNGEVFCSE